MARDQIWRTCQASNLLRQAIKSPRKSSKSTGIVLATLCTNFWPFKNKQLKYYSWKEIKFAKCTSASTQSSIFTAWAVFLSTLFDQLDLSPCPGEVPGFLCDWLPGHSVAGRLHKELDCLTGKLCHQQCNIQFMQKP